MGREGEPWEYVINIVNVEKLPCPNKIYYLAYSTKGGII